MSGTVQRMVTYVRVRCSKCWACCRQALDALANCACEQNPEQDSCYRCVYAYRRSRDMENTPAA